MRGSKRGHLVSKYSLLGFTLGGIGLGCIRGVIESLRLSSAYPFNPGGLDLVYLVVECAVAYGLIVGITGSLLIAMVKAGKPDES